jgi:hypothetical protein
MQSLCKGPRYPLFIWRCCIIHHAIARYQAYPASSASICANVMLFGSGWSSVAGLLCRPSCPFISASVREACAFAEVGASASCIMSRKVCLVRSSSLFNAASLTFAPLFGLVKKSLSWPMSPPSAFAAGFLASWLAWLAWLASGAPVVSGQNRLRLASSYRGLCCCCCCVRTLAPRPRRVASRLRLPRPDVSGIGSRTRKGVACAAPLLSHHSIHI